MWRNVNFNILTEAGTLGKVHFTQINNCKWGIVAESLYSIHLYDKTV